MTAFDRWVESQACELLKFCSSPGQEKLEFDQFRAFAVELNRRLGEEELTQQLRLSLSGFCAGMESGRRCTIRMLVNLCALQGLSIRDLLLDPRAAASRPLLDLWKDFNYFPLAPEQAATKVLISARCLRQILDHKRLRYIPAIRTVLRRFNVLPGILKDIEPELYAAYEARYVAQGACSQRGHMKVAFSVAMRMREEHRKKNSQPSPQRTFMKQLRPFVGIGLADLGPCVEAAILVEGIVSRLRAKTHERVVTSRVRIGLDDRPFPAHGAIR